MLSTTPLLTTNLARHDGFELLMTLLVVAGGCSPHGPYCIVVVVNIVITYMYFCSYQLILNVLKV